MLLSFFSFIVGLALLLLVFFVLINRQKDKKLNIYFLIIIGVLGLNRFLLGVEEFNLIDSFKSPIKDSFMHQFFMLIVGYLFFDNLLFKITPYKKVLLHLLFPTVFVLGSMLFPLNFDLVKVVFFLFSTCYVIFPGFLVWKYIYKRKNYKDNIHYQSIRGLALITYSIYFIFFVVYNYIFITNPQQSGSGHFVQFYTISSLGLLFLIVFIFKNPVILYGEQVLLKNLIYTSREEVNAWRSTKLEPTEKEDLDVEKKVKPRVEVIIFAIKKFEEELLEEFVELPSLKELAFKLDYPQSHLKYVFTYYSFCTFAEYQNNLKIKFALKLIKSGYLDTRTIDSLSSRCLFANKRTFYRNFKKWVGFTPSEYQSQFGSHFPLN
jgi:AraC-like DNA-binding protein